MHVEISKTETSKAQTLKTQTSKAPTSKTQTFKAETSKTQTSQPPKLNKHGSVTDSFQTCVVCLYCLLAIKRQTVCTFVTFVGDDFIETYWKLFNTHFFQYVVKFFRVNFIYFDCFVEWCLSTFEPVEFESCVISNLTASDWVSLHVEDIMTLKICMSKKRCPW